MAVPPVPPGPPAPPRQRRSPAKPIGIGCGCLTAAFVFFLVVGLIAGPSENTGSSDRASATKTSVPASPSTPTTPPPTTATASATPTQVGDVHARTMCRKTVQAAAYRAAGHSLRAEELQTEAMTEAYLSTTPAMDDLVTGLEPEKDIRAWCKTNLPKVTASPVPKKRKREPAPEPAPAPEPEPGGRTVTPGAFCEPAGAVGHANGRQYTCKGPGQPRWRR